jgi:hypothetical protein
MSNFMKILPVRAELLLADRYIDGRTDRQVDRQTDSRWTYRQTVMTKLIVLCVEKKNNYS